ncbi:MAG: hypothetical protein R2716_02910 [Microthrixaceae bacterium]
MGFLDKAKAAMDSAIAQGESALAGGANPKQADPLLRDLGVIAYLEATGRPVPDAESERRRCVEGIQAIEQQTTLNLQLTSAPPPAPGPPPGLHPRPRGAPPPPSAAPPPPPGAGPSRRPPSPLATIRHPSHQRRPRHRLRLLPAG